ncbi:response regulator [Natronospora cellulosivora (SeqCode)]
MKKDINVLVVDDSPFVFKAVKRSLEAKGLNVIGNARNGKIGLELIEKYNPDLITLDVTMPVMDGIETAKNIYKKNPEAKVIMMSAMGDEALIGEAREIGIDHFIHKPFKGDMLFSKVKEMFGDDI